MRKVRVKLQVNRNYIDGDGAVVVCTGQVPDDSKGNKQFICRRGGLQFYYNEQGQFLGHEDEPEYAGHVARPDYSAGNTYYTRDGRLAVIESFDERSEEYPHDGYIVNTSYTNGRTYDSWAGNGSVLYGRDNKPQDLLDYEHGYQNNTAREIKPALASEHVDTIQAAAEQVDCTQCPGDDRCCKVGAPAAPAAKGIAVLFGTADVDCLWDAYLRTIPHYLPTVDDLIAARAAILASVHRTIVCE